MPKDSSFNARCIYTSSDKIDVKVIGDETVIDATDRDAGSTIAIYLTRQKALELARFINSQYELI